MSAVQRVVVLVYAGDVWMARALVASIRRWYPEIAITLAKDLRFGGFDTGRLESSFGVDTLVVPPRFSGASIGKFWLLVRPERERYLQLDADTLFLGAVLGRLEASDADFLPSTHLVCDPDAPGMADYYDYERLKKLDPDFEAPGFTFSSGHFVASSGILTEEDLSPWLSWDDEWVWHTTEYLFYGADQGLLNYLLPRLAQDGRLTLDHRPYTLWGGGEHEDDLSLDEIRRGDGMPLILHYAGHKSSRLDHYWSSHVLSFFLDEFYRVTGDSPQVRGEDIEEGVAAWSRYRRFRARHRRRRPLRAALRLMQPPPLR